MLAAILDRAATTGSTMTDDTHALTDDNSIDIQPWPVIELIGRAVALATVARRGMLEVDDERDPFDLETDRFDLATWTRTELQNWITDDELRILNTPISDLSEEDLGTCDNALVSSTAVAWALRAVPADHLPLPENPEIDEQTLKWAPQPWEKVRSVQSRARLRSDEELATERERWELWYWRATDGGDDAEALGEVIDEVRETGLIPVVDNDLANDDGISFSSLSEDDQDDIAWLAELRLRALNWVCGFGESWESAPLYLED
jgi:hypothetical protein